MQDGNISGMATCLKRLENAKAQLTSPNSSSRQTFLNRLCHTAKNEMEKQYQSVSTSGKRKTQLQWGVDISEKNGEAMTVTAHGRDVLFLEFGSGLKRINGPDEHPEAKTYGYGFRTYSATHAKHLFDPHYLKAHGGAWFDPYHKVWVTGNPPAMGWYKARRKLKDGRVVKSLSRQAFNVFNTN